MPIFTGGNTQQEQAPAPTGGGIFSSATPKAPEIQEPQGTATAGGGSWWDRFIGGIVERAQPTFYQQTGESPQAQRTPLAGISEQFATGAAESASLGRFDMERYNPQVGEPATTAERRARTAGIFTGYALPFAGAEVTGGAGLAALAKGGVSKIAQPLARAAAQRGIRGVGTGLTFGAAEGIAEGRGASETVQQAVTDGLVFGILEAALPVAGAGIRKLAPSLARRLTRQGAAAGRATVERGEQLLLPERAGGADFIGGTAERLRARKFILEGGDDRLSRIVQQIRPETERRIEQAIQLRTILAEGRIPPTESKRAMVEFLAEAMPQAPKGGFQRASIPELTQMVESIAQGAQPQGALNIARQVAREMGVDLDREFALAQMSPIERLKSLSERERLAQVAGVKPRPGLARSGEPVTEPFVQQVQGAPLAATSRRIQRVAQPGSPEWEAVVGGRRIEPPPRVEPEVASSAIREARQNAKYEGFKKLILNSESWLKRQGPAGQRIARLYNEAEYLTDSSVGARINQVLPKAQDLSKEERLLLRSVVRGEATTTNKRVLEAAEAVNRYYNERPSRIQEVGLSLRTRSGENIPFQPQQNHFPTRFDWEKMTDGQGRFKKDVLRRLVDTGQAKDLAEADQLLRVLRRLPRERLAPFQHEASNIRLPEYEKDPLEALRIDINQGERRIAEARVYGPRDEQLFEALQEMPELARPHAQKIVEHLRGTTEEEQTMKALANGILNYQVVTKLGLAAISNAFQSVNTIMETNVRSFLSGLVDVFRNPREAMEFAQKAGVLLDPGEIARALAETEGFSTKFLRVTGFEATETMNRVFAAQAAKGWADDLFRAIQGKNVGWLQAFKGQTEQRARRVLGDAGINVDEALKRGFLSQDDLQRAAWYIVRHTQFPSKELDLPLWTRSTWGRVAFQFKRFAYRQTGLVKRNLWDETKLYFESGGKDGSLRQWPVFLTLYPSAGYLIGSIRDAISGRERPEGTLSTLMDAYGWVGGLGLFSDFMEQISRDPTGAVVSLFGPTASTVGSVFGVGQALLKGIGGEIAYRTGEAEEPPDWVAVARRGYKAAVRGNVPFIGYNLGRGEVAFGKTVPGLKEFASPKEAREEAFVNAMVTGNREQLNTLIRNGQVTQAQLRGMMQSQRIQQKILGERIRREADPEKKRKLESQLERLKKYARRRQPARK